MCLINKVLITARAEVELLGKKIIKDNITTTEKYCKISDKPLIFLISLKKNRYTNTLIQKSKCFCINMMNETSEGYFKHKLQLCEEKRGEHVDKFKLCNLLKEECTSIDCCCVKEAKIKYECEMLKSDEIGDSIVYYGNVIRIVS